MNADMEELFADAADRQLKIERKVVDDAIMGGAHGAAELLDNAELRERMSRMAFEQALAGQRPNIEPNKKGPSRRSAPKVAARKRARKARRNNR